MNFDGTIPLRALRVSDLMAIARAVERQQLADLGLDCHGRWVGFDEAARLLSDEAGS